MFIDNFPFKNKPGLNILIHLAIFAYWVAFLCLIMP
jgi:hypothetical protein